MQRKYNMINLKTIKQELKDLWKKENPKKIIAGSNEVIDFVINKLFDRAIKIESKQIATAFDQLCQKSPNELKIKKFSSAMIEISNTLSQFTTAEESIDQSTNNKTWRFSIILLPLCYRD